MKTKFEKIGRRSVIKTMATGLAASAFGGWPLGAFADEKQGVTDTEILIGGLGPITGPTAFIGGPGRDGMQLAIDKINESGPINGRKLRMTYEHAATPAESVAAAKKLTENDKVFILVLASGSTGAAAAADYVRAAKIPTYNIFGATPIIREPFARNIFHGSMPAPEVTGGEMVNEVFKAVPGVKKVGVLAGTYAFPQANLKAMAPILKSRGLEVVLEQFDVNANDYTAQLVSFARQRVQAIIVLGSFTEAGFAIKQAPDKGLVDVAWILDGSGTNDAIVSIIGKENSKNLWGYYNAPYFPSQTDSPIVNFIKIWTAKYGQPPQGRPSLYDIVSYGCTYVMAQAIKNAGRDLTWSSLMDSWEKLKNAKPSDMGGYDVIFPETVTAADHQGNKLVGPSRIVDGKWKVVP
jgi:branched-chain amino acid transport system substrate-binding protein